MLIVIVKEAAYTLPPEYSSDPLAVVVLAAKKAVTALAQLQASY